MIGQIEPRLAQVWALSVGEEIVIDNRVWYRIDRGEYKVHNLGTDPDSPVSDTSWVPRDEDDIRAELERAI